MPLPVGNPQTAYTLKPSDLVQVNMDDSGKPVVSGNCFRLNTILQQLNARIPKISTTTGTSVNEVVINQGGGGGGGGSIGSFWTLSGILLYPNSTTYRVLVGRVSDDGTGAMLQVFGSPTQGSINAGGAIQSAATGANICFQGNSGTFIVNGAGAVSCAGPVHIAGQTGTWGILSGLSTSDVTLSGKGGAVLGDSLVIVSATSNASALSLNVVAGTYTTVTATRTGSGTNLPMAFFVGGAERERIVTGGQLLRGITSTDASTNPGAIIINDSFVSVTAATNASVGSFAAVAGSYVSVNSNKTGSGTQLPLAFFVNAGERARILTTGQLLVGLTSTDLSFSNNGAIVSNDSIVSATAATNASIIDIGYSAGSYTALSSGRSGSGTFLPLAFFTNNAERMRILTTGQLLVGMTSTDLSLGNGAVVSNDSFNAANATTNTSVMGMGITAGTYGSLYSSKTGSGTYLPMALFTSATERMRILTTGQVLVGLTSTDLSLGNGAVVSNDSFNAATAATNASVMGMAIVASTYGSLYASKTGSGTNLDMAFFTAQTERMRIGSGQTLAAGHVVIGYTTSDYSQSGGSGSFQCGGDIVAVSASSNANTVVLRSVDGFCDIKSGVSGAGSYKDMRFFNNGVERMRLFVGGNFVLNGTTDHGFLLQNNGQFYNSGDVMIGSTTDHGYPLQVTGVIASYTAGGVLSMAYDPSTGELAIAGVYASNGQVGLNVTINSPFTSMTFTGGILTAHT